MRSSGVRVALVACSASKLDRPAPARELYTGTAFRLAVAYAEVCGAAWYVLSAKHGVVAPDEVLEPYDVSMSQLLLDGGRRTHPSPLGAWATRCRGALMKDRASGALVRAGDVVELLAPAAYANPLAGLLRAWGAVAETPLSGLGIGSQLGWLKSAAEKALGEAAP